MKYITLGVILVLATQLAIAQTPLGDVKICFGGQVKLKATSTPGNTFLWYKNGTQVDGITGSSLTVTEPGDYSAVACSPLGCLSVQSLTVKVLLNGPTAVDDDIYVVASGSTLLDPFDNDLFPCGAIDTTSLVIESQAKHGTVSVQGGKFKYVIPPNYKGTDSFEYSVMDANGIPTNVAKIVVHIEQPLPVVLSSFQVVKENKSALLNWVTTSEVNALRFEVERSSNATNWERIGQVTAKNTLELSRYNFRDDFPLAGTNYYRLRMVDKDGSSANSPMRSVYFDIPELIVAYPNPVSEVLNIRIQNEAVTKVDLFDIAGRLIESRMVTGKEMKLYMQKYASGYYIIRASGKQNQLQTIKIHKE